MKKTSLTLLLILFATVVFCAQNPSKRTASDQGNKPTKKKHIAEEEEVTEHQLDNFSGPVVDETEFLWKDPEIEFEDTIPDYEGEYEEEDEDEDETEKDYGEGEEEEDYESTDEESELSVEDNEHPSDSEDHPTDEDVENFMHFVDNAAAVPEQPPTGDTEQIQDVSPEAPMLGI